MSKHKFTIFITLPYVIQQGSERGETVSLPVGERTPLFVLCSPCRLAPLVNVIFSL